MLANMNRSERLHNQCNEQQNMTPELELSMQLRAKCEQLLDENGKTVIDLAKVMLLITPLLPLGVLEMVISSIKNKGLPSLREKEVLLVGKSNQPEIKILSHGTTIPSRSKSITVHIPKLDHSPADVKVLKLEREEVGKIETRHILNFQFYGRDPNTTRQTETRLATMEELETYQRYIKQNSPIEHK